MLMRDYWLQYIIDLIINVYAYNNYITHGNQNFLIYWSYDFTTTEGLNRVFILMFQLSLRLPDPISSRKA